jgi:hypothetical protein
MTIESHWPHLFRRGELVPRDLSGATILEIGTAKGATGLAIRYRPSGASEDKTLLIDFNEVGMWVHAQSG